MRTTEGQTSWPPPPELMKTSESALKEARGISAEKGKTAQPKTRSAFATMYRKTGEASQPPASCSTASDTSVVEEVRQAIRAKLTKNLKNLGINPEIHESSAGSHSVIDLATMSISSPILSSPSVIPGSLIPVANTPSHAGNGRIALGFSHLTHATHATSLPQMFSTMHWKPKKPTCFFGRSTEDVHN